MANFIDKTFAMLQEPSNNHTVRWSASGATLVVDKVRVTMCQFLRVPARPSAACRAFRGG
jgi:hypothetical protein